MDRELLELFEAAKKAADAAAANGVSSRCPKVDRCLDVLNQLQSYPVTYDVLVSTQVAKRLRPLTKHPDEQIHKRVSEVLEVWKRIIISEATKKKNDGKKDGGIDNRNSRKPETIETRTVKIEEVHKTGSIKVENISKTETFKNQKIDEDDFVKPGGVSRPETIKVEKKVETVEEVEQKQVISSSESVKVENFFETLDTVKTEKVDWSKSVKVEIISKEEKPASSTKKPSQAYNAPPKLTSLIKCNDAIRDKVRELLLEALSKVFDEVDEDTKDEVNACDPIRVAVSIESVMFDKMGRSNGTQKVKYRSLLFNLKDPKNPDLRRKVLLGQVNPERLVNMTPQEMASDERQHENNQIKEKALFECERGGPPKATTDQFRCGRCRQRKCTYYQLQTRSADEPMTTFVTCVNCNNRWKFC